ncbi:helix-turn-helix domain-containing protein [Roseovarius amoyensis]|uniref:helix-turn-helix domain-containing protein n=1 Tax=Roseovarius amoyensis TaxID=2211448 RepID=UPI000DBE7C51|nr:helix-turn-helix transcriptional regulator [Roseovarius amoyensis]
MAQTLMIGSRIRERRVMNGLKQSELARRAGISASYLNLIEHNRRRIGGSTLIRLAEILGVPPALLSEGAEATLIAALREAAARAEAYGHGGAEADRAEEFAARFPGWAALLAELGRQCVGLGDTVKALTDRLAHDPHLAASLHEVISTVTAIRSTASILADTQALEPEWQNRFHRNLDEDSRRLATGAEALVRYLEAAPDARNDIKSPQDELHAFLEDYGFHFSELEGIGGAGRIEALIAGSKRLETDAARSLTRDLLSRYVLDARRLPLEEMTEAISRHGLEPDAITDATGADTAMVFRRLAMLPESVAGPVGLVVCDGSGTLMLRKPALGFVMPRAAGACALWPLYQLLAQPGTPLRVRLRQGDARVLALTVSDIVVPARFDRPAVARPHMLLLPDPGREAAGPAREVGMTCRLCPLNDCDARREPSILGGSF